MTVDSIEEEYFPRGGKHHEIKKKRNFVFEKKGANEPKPKKPGRRERKKANSVHRKASGEELEDTDVVFERFERLTYERLSIGTLTLCSVRAIHNRYIDVSLPGRLSARLHIDNISDPYLSILNQDKSIENGEAVESLDRLFKVGQYLACSVLSVTNVGHFSVRVSSNPSIVNSRLTFSDVSENMILQMAVKSVEDHGYMMFSGISGLIAFLPSANAASFLSEHQNSNPLCIGQIVWCLVTRTKLTDTSNTVHVSLDFKRIRESVFQGEISMQKLLPGVKVKIILNKVVSDTIFVDLDSDIHGYVEDSQLNTSWSMISDYKMGTQHTATVLYKFPYAKILALTLKADPTSFSKEEIKRGTTFQDAEIVSIMKRGVCLKLNHCGRFLKGIISVRRLGGADAETLSSRFPIGNHITCRVVGYDALEQVYSCSSDDKVLNEKYLSPDDLKIGEVVDVTVESMKNRGFEVSVGLVKGFVPATQITDVIIQNPLEKIKLKSKLKGKVYKNDHTKLIITLRPTLVKNPSLTSFDTVKVGDGYYGTVTKVQTDHIIVSFYGDLFAPINEKNLLEPPHKYSYGELVKCYVVKKRPRGPPILSLLRSVQNMALTVGNTYDLIVKEVLPDGLKCFFMSQDQQFNGFLPLQHFSDYPEFCKTEMKKYPLGTVISDVLLLSVNEKFPLFTMRKSVTDFFEVFPELREEGIKVLKKNMPLPCSVSEISSDRILVCAPIPGFNGKIPILSQYLPGPIRTYSPYQSLIASIQEVLPYNVGVKLTCKHPNERKLKFSEDYIKNLIDYLCSLQTYQMGKNVKCLVQEMEEYRANVTIFGSKTPGILVGFEPGSLNSGEKLKALVLFDDVSNGTTYLHTNNGSLSLAETPDESLKGSTISGTVIFSGNYFTLVLVHLTTIERCLAFVPMMNDLNYPEKVISHKISPLSSCTVTLRSFHQLNNDNKIYYWIANLLEIKQKKGKKNKLKDEPTLANTDNEISKGASEEKKKKITENNGLRVTKQHDVENDANVEVNEEKLSKKKRKKNKKRKMEEALDAGEHYELVPSKGKKVKQEMKLIDNDRNTGFKGNIKSRISDPVLASLEDAASFNWNVTTSDLTKAIFPDVEEPLIEEDSDEEVEVKKKLTPAEKRAAAAEKEREIRAKEEELLLAESKPQSADHFDRLLTASPNSSKLWIMYMAFHMQATEIEKARAVAKRALKHINVRLEDERLNVWIASLNLENIYGTPESFKEVLTDALKYNDDYKVKQRVLNIYAESNKTDELDKLAHQLVKKYKANIDCWLECQEALMKAGLVEKARNYLQRSLEALSTKEYCTLISRFALVENKYGYPEQAQSLFENLLTSYPKRTDIWFVYVDMLTKSGSVDLARNVLERATSHKLPIRKMKSLYQKWLKVEESFGTPESVEKVKEAATAYVNNITSALHQNEEMS